MGGRISGVNPWRRWRAAVPVANPAAGADWSITVPAGEVWDIRSVVATLTTSATAGNRSVYLEASDGATTVVRVVPYTNSTASLTNRYSWYPGATALSFGNDQQDGIPDLVLQSGWTLSVVTAGLAAGDQWSAVAIMAIRTLYRAGDVDISELPELVVQLTPGS